MKLLLENVNILDDSLADKIKTLIVNANIDNNKVYDIEVQFGESIIITNDMYNYFINKVPEDKYNKYKKDKKYEDIKGIEDGDFFVGDILSDIIYNIRAELSDVINIFNAKITGYEHICEDNIRIYLKESDQDDVKNGMKVTCTMPSYTYFINTAKKEFRKIEDRKKRELEYQKQLKKRLEKKNKSKEGNKLDDIAQQLGVSKDSLQAFIEQQKNENKE